MELTGRERGTTTPLRGGPPFTKTLNVHFPLRSPVGRDRTQPPALLLSQSRLPQAAVNCGVRRQRPGSTPRKTNRDGHCGAFLLGATRPWCRRTPYAQIRGNVRTPENPQRLVPQRNSTAALFLGTDRTQMGYTIKRESGSNSIADALDIGVG